MKKPKKLCIVGMETLKKLVEEIDRYMSVGAMLDYEYAVRRLLDKYIPFGWEVYTYEVDLDALNKHVDRLHRSFEAADTMRCCDSSCDTLKAADMFLERVVRFFILWMYEQFELYGKEVK